MSEEESRSSVLLKGLAPYEGYVCWRGWHPIDNMAKWMVKGIGVTAKCVL